MFRENNNLFKSTEIKTNSLNIIKSKHISQVLHVAPLPNEGSIEKNDSSISSVTLDTAEKGQSKLLTPPDDPRDDNRVI